MQGAVRKSDGEGEILFDPGTRSDSVAVHPNPGPRRCTSDRQWCGDVAQKVQTVNARGTMLQLGMRSKQNRSGSLGRVYAQRGLRLVDLDMVAPRTSS